mgnify:FL=1
MLESASQQVIRLPRICAWALRPLPLPPLQFALERLLASSLKRHPDLISRLAPVEGRRIAVEPSDLPFVALLSIGKGTISLRVARTVSDEAADSRIRGPLLALIGLVDGVYDGDALFFSRDLVIEGDVEAVLALRNAIDNADVDMIGEVAATLGPFAAPFDQSARGITRLLGIALSGNDGFYRGNAR